MYSDKKWWAHTTIASDWHFYLDTQNNDTLALVYRRPDTGEETRAWLWSNLILGCKGIIMDREYTWPVLTRDYTLPKINFNSGWPWTALGLGMGQPFFNFFRLDRFNGESFIYHDSTGADFINLISDSTCLYRYLDVDFIRDSMQVQPNRIYKGQKSTRIEVYKTFKLIKETETILNKLNFVSAFSKGYREWYHQDTARFSSTNILANFISLDTSTLNTKKLWDPLTNSNPIQKESWDTSFFDITLLRDSSDHSLTSSTFYIGVQNRRTDPLLPFSKSVVLKDKNN